MAAIGCWHPAFGVRFSMVFFVPCFFGWGMMGNVFCFGGGDSCFLVFWGVGDKSGNWELLATPFDMGHLSEKCHTVAIHSFCSALKCWSDLGNLTLWNGCWRPPFFFDSICISLLESNLPQCKQHATQPEKKSAAATPGFLLWLLFFFQKLCFAPLLPSGHHQLPTFSHGTAGTFTQFLLDGGNSFSKEFIHQHGEGTLIQPLVHHVVHLVLALDLDPLGKLEGILGTIEDCTSFMPGTLVIFLGKFQMRRIELVWKPKICKLNPCGAVIFIKVCKQDVVWFQVAVHIASLMHAVKSTANCIENDVVAWCHRAAEGGESG